MARVQRLLSSSEQMNKLTNEQCYNRVDVMSRDDEQLMIGLRQYVDAD